MNTQSAPRRIGKSRKLSYIKKLLALLLVVSAGITLIYGIFQLVNQKINKSTISTKSQLSGEIIATVNNSPINEHGLILNSPVSTDTPNINVKIDKLYGGEVLNSAEILTTLGLFQEAEAQQVEVTDVTIYNRDYMELKVEDGILVIYNDSSDAYSLIATLKSMLSVFTIEGDKPKSIDYRFDKPIVRY